MLKAVIFDMDGVIIDSEPMHAKAGVLALKKCGVDITTDYCYGFIGTTTYCMCQKMIRDFHLQTTAEELFEANQEMKHYLLNTEGYPVIPYVTDLIKDLHSHGVKLIIASSSPAEAIEYVRKTLSLESYFDGYVSGMNVSNPKPAPDIFLAAAKQLGVTPSECVVIEDSTNGVLAADAAGMTCIGYVNPNSGKQDLSKASVLVEGFDEVDYDYINEVYRHSHHEPVQILSTKRLIVRELAMEDFEELYRISTDPLVMKYLPDFSLSKEEEREKLQAYIRTVYPYYGYGLWGVCLKSDQKLIGKCGIEYKEADGTGEYEIGYLIGSKYQGQGFALEAAKAVIRYFFTKYKVPRIVAVIDRNNISSIRLAEWLGMVKDGETCRYQKKCLKYILDYNKFHKR